jgi:hypothetical protein
MNDMIVNHGEKMKDGIHSYDQGVEHAYGPSTSIVLLTRLPCSTAYAERSTMISQRQAVVW